MAESEQPDQSQKTEEPTQKKLEDSREKGQVPLSREVNNWLMLLAATLLIAMSAPSILDALRDHLAIYIEQAHALPLAPGGLKVVLGESFLRVLTILALPLFILMVVAFLGPFVQIGFLFAPETALPKLDRVSPVKGFGRLFSLRAFMEFLKGLFKIALVSSVVWIVLSPYYESLDSLAGLPAPLLLPEAQGLVIRLMTGILIALLVIAGADVAFQRNEHYKKMRMTKQEIKDEYKQAEGDPHIKGKLRQLRAERARVRMMQSVPEADVVITNPTHFSVALKYDPETMDAPRLVAKGVDQIALRIREVAKEHDVMIYENPPLARVLYASVEIDQAIPTEHYKAVAEVISYVFRAQGKLK